MDDRNEEEYPLDEEDYQSVSSYEGSTMEEEEVPSIEELQGEIAALDAEFRSGELKGDVNDVNRVYMESYVPLLVRLRYVQTFNSLDENEVARLSEEVRPNANELRIYDLDTVKRQTQNKLTVALATLSTLYEEQRREAAEEVREAGESAEAAEGEAAPRRRRAALTAEDRARVDPAAAMIAFLEGVTDPFPDLRGVPVDVVVLTKASHATTDEERDRAFLSIVENKLRGYRNRNTNFFSFASDVYGRETFDSYEAFYQSLAYRPVPRHIESQRLALIFTVMTFRGKVTVDVVTDFQTLPTPALLHRYGSFIDVDRDYFKPVVAKYARVAGAPPTAVARGIAAILRAMNPVETIAAPLPPAAEPQGEAVTVEAVRPKEYIDTLFASSVLVKEFTTAAAARAFEEGFIPPPLAPGDPITLRGEDAFDGTMEASLLRQIDFLQSDSTDPIRWAEALALYRERAPGAKEDYIPSRSDLLHYYRTNLSVLRESVPENIPITATVKRIVSPDLIEITFQDGHSAVVDTAIIQPRGARRTYGFNISLPVIQPIFALKTFNGQIKLLYQWAKKLSVDTAEIERNSEYYQTIYIQCCRKWFETYKIRKALTGTLEEIYAQMMAVPITDKMTIPILLREEVPFIFLRRLNLPDPYSDESSLDDKQTEDFVRNMSAYGFGYVAPLDSYRNKLYTEIYSTAAPLAEAEKTAAVGSYFVAKEGGRVHYYKRLADGVEMVAAEYDLLDIMVDKVVMEGGAPSRHDWQSILRKMKDPRQAPGRLHRDVVRVWSVGPYYFYTFTEFLFAKRAELYRNWKSLRDRGYYSLGDSYSRKIAAIEKYLELEPDLSEAVEGDLKAASTILSRSPAVITPHLRAEARRILLEVLLEQPGTDNTTEKVEALEQTIYNEDLRETAPYYGLVDYVTVAIRTIPGLAACTPGEIVAVALQQTAKKAEGPSEGPSDAEVENYSPPSDLLDAWGVTAEGTHSAQLATIQGAVGTMETLIAAGPFAFEKAGPPTQSTDYQWLQGALTQTKTIEGPVVTLSGTVPEGVLTQINAAILWRGAAHESLETRRAAMMTIKYGTWQEREFRKKVEAPLPGPLKGTKVSFTPEFPETRRWMEAAELPVHGPHTAIMGVLRENLPRIRAGAYFKTDIGATLLASRIPFVRLRMGVYFKRWPAGFELSAVPREGALHLTLQNYRDHLTDDEIVDLPPSLRRGRPSLIPTPKGPIVRLTTNTGGPDLVKEVYQDPYETYPVPVGWTWEGLPIFGAGQEEHLAYHLLRSEMSPWLSSRALPKAQMPFVIKPYGPVTIPDPERKKGEKGKTKTIDVVPDVGILSRYYMICIFSDPVYNIAYRMRVGVASFKEFFVRRPPQRYDPLNEDRVRETVSRIGHGKRLWEVEWDLDYMEIFRGGRWVTVGSEYNPTLHVNDASTLAKVARPELQRSLKGLYRREGVEISVWDWRPEGTPDGQWAEDHRIWREAIAAARDLLRGVLRRHGVESAAYKEALRTQREDLELLRPTLPSERARLAAERNVAKVEGLERAMAIPYAAEVRPVDEGDTHDMDFRLTFHALVEYGVLLFSPTIVDMLRGGWKGTFPYYYRVIYRGGKRVTEAAERKPTRETDVDPLELFRNINRLTATGTQSLYGRLREVLHRHYGIRYERGVMTGTPKGAPTFKRRTARSVVRPTVPSKPSARPAKEGGAEMSLIPVAERISLEEALTRGPSYPPIPKESYEVTVRDIYNYLGDSYQQNEDYRLARQSNMAVVIMDGGASFTYDDKDAARKTPMRYLTNVDGKAFYVEKITGSTYYDTVTRSIPVVAGDLHGRGAVTSSAARRLACALGLDLGAVPPMLSYSARGDHAVGVGDVLRYVRTGAMREFTHTHKITDAMIAKYQKDLASILAEWDRDATPTLSELWEMRAMKNVTVEKYQRDLKDLRLYTNRHERTRKLKECRLTADDVIVAGGEDPAAVIDRASSRLGFDVMKWVTS